MEQVRIKGGNVRMRMSPSSSGTEIATIPEGTIVTLENKKNDLWWLVGYKGKTGYVMKPFLESVDAPEVVRDLTLTIPEHVIAELYKACKKVLKK